MSLRFQIPKYAFKCNLRNFVNGITHGNIFQTNKTISRNHLRSLQTRNYIKTGLEDKQNSCVQRENRKKNKSSSTIPFICRGNVFFSVRGIPSPPNFGWWHFMKYKTRYSPAAMVRVLPFHLFGMSMSVNIIKLWLHTYIQRLMSALNFPNFFLFSFLSAESALYGSP